MTTYCGAASTGSADALQPLQIRTPEQRMADKDAQRRRSVPKITGRKLRMPRKFVVTDVPDEDLDAPQLSLSPTKTPDPLPWEETSTSEDLSASSSSVRKGKTQVKGRFTIIDLSPESPEPASEREDLSASVGPTPSRPLDTPRRRSARKMASRRPFQSAGDVRATLGLAYPKPNEQQAESPVFASFRRPVEASPSFHPMAPTRHASSPTLFDHHLEFLEKESQDMKAVLENMVATNAQWIEALASAGLGGCAPSPARLSEASLSEAVTPVETPLSILEHKYQEVEQAYTELQTKYEKECQKNERMEVKNAMLEIRLQQQINRSTMLRSQLDKLTQYTENLIGESSEPTLHDYSSDLNSLFGEQSSMEAHSPTAEEMDRNADYSFNYEVVKTHRQRRHSVDEECMSDTSTEGESLRKISSPSPFEQEEDNNMCFSDMELTAGDLTSGSDEPSGPTALDSLLDDQVNQLQQSLRSKLSMSDGVERVSSVGSLDSLAVCPSSTAFGAGDDDDRDETDNQIGHSLPVENERVVKHPLIKHSSSLASINYSTVSSTSSLASYGLQLAAIGQAKVSFYAGMAATSMFGPHPEPYPGASNQHSVAHEEEDVYTALSPENLRFHDCQSLLQAAEESGAAKPTSRLNFLFRSQLQNPPVSSTGPNEGSGRIDGLNSMYQRRR
ncbi:hypothetical protein BBJ28_00015552 [Nothophytophthora sp. Chile5]|nr:hypothetical protein BBJ28_00015552 [Nothophytophthora sp. Chile5]